MKIQGAKVIDGKKPIRLLISADDVKRGTKKRPDCCAAALACKRQIPGVVAAAVHLSRVYLHIKRNGKMSWVRYMTGPALRTEIVAFDKGGEFSAGEYHLATIQPTVRFGAKRKRYDYSEGPKRGTKSPRSKRHVVSNVRASPFNPAISSQ